MKSLRLFLLVVILGGAGLYWSQSSPVPSVPVTAGVASPMVNMAAVAPVAMPAAAPMVPAPPRVELQPMEGQPMAALGPTSPNTADPVPANYIPRKLKVFEGHWQGMDARLLTVELARKLQFPPGLRGALLGEVTLNAVTAGLMAGDVIIRLEDMPIASIEDLQEASRMVMNRNEVHLTVMRKDGHAFRTLTLTLRAERGLGFVQVEGAPMIQPGDPRPHPYRGQCTDCHSVGTGFELAPDPDLISLPPPVISRTVAAGGVSPHEDRGPCEACHVIK